MNKKEYEKLYDYLGNNCDQVAKHFEKDQDGNITGKFEKTSSCKKSLIEKAFDTKIACEQYDVVANGEGNEGEKIDTIYSSSLQSLLVFHKVEKGNEIVIGDESFNKVIFEYKNKVIGYPSSIDVVLLNDHAIAFVESKFLEIVRDSNKKGNKVIGISYFGAKENGYKAIKLDLKDLERMKICHNYDGPISIDPPYLESVAKLSKNKQAIEPLDKESFVYSEGIKQILSHIIGINSFKDGGSAYAPKTDPISDHKKFKKIIYIELYNEFVGLDFAFKKIEDFKKHVEVVQKVVKEKEIVDEFLVMSYQELYKNNDKYRFDKRVVSYFGLDKTQTDYGK